MRINEMIQQLTRIQSSSGNIEVQLQEIIQDNEGVLKGAIFHCDMPGGEMIVNHTAFFIVKEEYDDGWYVNIRTWPY